jgi:general secretion pathway protein D
MVTLIRRVGPHLALVLVALCGAAGLSFAQTQPATQPVVLDFPADGIELKTLADIVTRRLGIPIIYDEAIDGKRVIVRVPREVPEDALLGILQSALRMKQMALVDAEQPGWKQIVAAANLATVARPVEPGAPRDPGSAVTQVLTLRHADPAKIIEAVRPLLTQPGGNVLPVPGQRLLVVSDYPSVVARVEQVARMLDSSGPALETRFVPLKEADAGAVANTVNQILTSRETYLRGAAGGSDVLVTPDERVNQIVVLAPPDRMKEVVDLITGMDRAADLVTKVYRLKAVGPERIDRLMKDVLGTAARRMYQASVDRESQALIVSATPSVIARLDALIEQLDRPVTAEESPIRFYKLKNTAAADVLATIEGLTGDEGLEEFGPEDEQDQSGDVGPVDAPPTLREIAPEAQDEPRPPIRPLPRDERQQMRAAEYDAPEPEPEPASRTVRGRDATVTADVNTNSIIVIAPPAVQQMYEQLIRRLDVRRPQVQIECTIVTLDTSDQFSLAVDVGFGGSSGDNAIISFSSFGVSVVDPVTGSLTPTRGRGGTFALLSPGNVDIVMRALSANSRARLISAPQLLVNDNGKGQLKSVAQEPFAEIIDSNASQAITSFGGQAEAGTSIVVEPHISEDDYLQLSYSIELSNFTGTAREGLPPPSQSNSVDSTVTIPDGHTIVVGGLNTKNFRAAVDSIPGIDRIPLLKYLFGSRTRSSTDTTLFVFIRPTILRDDKFADLKYLSGRAADRVSIGGDYPPSNPIPMR